MTFSIVIPVYNAERTIIRALESCIAQEYLPEEIILVDDRGNDNAMKLVTNWIKTYKGKVEIIVYSMPRNSGPSAARNRGWNMAGSDYISFLDADDYFAIDKLKRVHDVLKKNPQIHLLGHAHSIVEQEQKIMCSDILTQVSVYDILLKNRFATPTVIVKRDIPQRFDDAMSFTEDHDLWLRLTQFYGQTYFLNCVLTIIDRPINSSGGQSGHLWEMRKGEIEMYKKYCHLHNKMYLFPLLTLFSLSKHMLKLLKR